jgi:hypothetical protein
MRSMQRKITNVTQNVIVSERTMKSGSIGRSTRIFDMMFFLSRNTLEARVTVLLAATCYPYLAPDSQGGVLPILFVSTGHGEVVLLLPVGQGCVILFPPDSHGGVEL